SCHAVMMLFGPTEYSSSTMHLDGFFFFFFFFLLFSPLVSGWEVHTRAQPFELRQWYLSTDPGVLDAAWWELFSTGLSLVQVHLS
ncbi:hypothetical protein V8C42DRAFT_320125, partial [Trichoderma barbatum]